MVFVTGGTGLIGSHLLFELASGNNKVRALKRNTSDIQKVIRTFSRYSDNPEVLFNQIEWVDGDILDYFSMEKLLSGVTEVYNCAAIVTFNRKERKKIIKNNVEGTANIVNACIENGIKKICHLSSVSALGKAQEGLLINEQTHWIPSKKNSGYSESKFFSETEIWRGIEEGLDAVIINPSIVIGPGNWDSGSSQLFTTVWNGIKFYTKGITGYVDVKDVVKAAILLMEDSNFSKYKNQRYLLNAQNLSYHDLFNQIADALGRRRPQFFAPPFVLKAACLTSALVRILYRKFPSVTYEIASAASAINKFDGCKISRLLKFEYIPIHQSIKQTAQFFKEDLGTRKK